MSPALSEEAGASPAGDASVAVPEVEILVEDDAWSDADAPRLLALAHAACAAAGGCTPGATIALVLANDATLADLNRRFRGQDAATNVLSFPALSMPGAVGPQPLGDVMVARETLVREATELGLPLADHLAHLVVHGVLHLMGHDHHEPAEAEVMEALETRILAGFGIPDPYRRTVESVQDPGACAHLPP